MCAAGGIGPSLPPPIYHLLQNEELVKGRDERQAALDVSHVSPTTHHQSASSNSLLSVSPQRTPPHLCCSLAFPAPPAEESKQVQPHRFHLLQNMGHVKGRDERQAALDASHVSPATPSPSGVAKPAFLVGLLFPILGGPLCRAEI